MPTLPTEPVSAPQGRTVGLKTLTVMPSRLEGSVRVSGAKNSVLRLLAASLLTAGTIRLRNYPAGLLDAIVHVGMLERLGKTCSVDGDTLTIRESAVPPGRLEWDGRSIRNTLLILGALTARTGEGSVPLPGGCKLGDRKYDLHVMLLERLGARVWEDGDNLCAAAPGGLIGNDIYLPMRSTGATENALLCGALARGRTRIWNPHVRPEILDLAKFLNALGARITVHGQESIEIEGVDALGALDYTVMPDNMEALTWLVGAVVSGGDVTIEDFPAHDIEVPLIFLRDSGARFTIEGSTARVHGGRPFPVEICTGPYPGINSDMQPLFGTLGACATGQSRIDDLRFADRFGYLDEFARMGIASRVDGRTAIIQGGTPIHGAEVRALDLRTGAALALLGLVAQGRTVIADAWQIERGYDGFVDKLTALGARIEPTY